MHFVMKRQIRQPIAVVGAYEEREPVPLGPAFPADPNRPFTDRSSSPLSYLIISGRVEPTHAVPRQCRATVAAHHFSGGWLV